MTALRTISLSFLSFRNFAHYLVYSDDAMVRRFFFIFSRISWTKISKNTYFRCAVWQIITSTQSWRQKASFTLPCSTQGRDYKISQSIKNSFFQNLVRKVIGPNIPLPFWEAPILQGRIHGTELPELGFGHDFRLGCTGDLKKAPAT